MPLDPQSIRAALTSTLRGEFDHEWDVVLDEAKKSKDLGGSTACYTSGGTSRPVKLRSLAGTIECWPRLSRSCELVAIPTGARPMMSCS